MDGKYSNAINRWQGIGPYYAMFPAGFAQSVITEYTKEGDSVLDPFVGRGTSIFAAATNNRSGIGIEINPVGWVYAKAKLSPAPEDEVIDRLLYLSRISSGYNNKLKALPEFFRYCYSPTVLSFLLAARNKLMWHSNKIDTTLMALILVNLHGKYGNALSNQMRQTKSMSPQYSINWWKEKKLHPPHIDPKDFFTKRIEWRYKKGLPSLTKSTVYLGDSSILLDKIGKQIAKKPFGRPRLLFTSPPYIGITNYHYDQWLRLWMLGYPTEPTMLKDKYRRKFDDSKEYADLLEKVFKKSTNFLRSDAIVYVRTDQRKETYRITRDTLLRVFPKKKLIEKVRMFRKPTQTSLFTKKSYRGFRVRGGEVDLIMIP